MAAKTRLQVKRWVQGADTVEIDAAQLPDDVEWALQVDAAPNRTVTISQRTSIPDRLEVSMGLRMGPAHSAAFKALSDAQRARFVYALRRDAILLGVFYQGIGDPLVRMGYTRRVYVNALTQTSFMDAFYAVQNALILARGFVQIHLGPGDTDTGATDIEPDGPFGDFLSGLDLGDI